MRAVITAVTAHDTSRSVRSYHFRTEGPLHYLAGQFVELTLPGSHDQGGATRQLTLSSEPHEATAAVTVDLAEYRSSFKHHLAGMTAGDEIDVSQAMGDFVLPLDTSRPMAWVAGGVGVTPFRSLALALKHEAGHHSVRFIHAYSKPQHHDLFRQQIEPVVNDYNQHGGRISVQDVLGVVQDSATDIYIAGPETMVHSLSTGLQAAGIEKERIITDAFLGYR